MDNSMELYPLTHPQLGIWYIEKFYPETSIGNVAGTVIIEEDVDYYSLEKAINIAIERNDAMRFRVSEADGNPIQYVAEYEYVKLDYVDLSVDGAESIEEWSNKKTRVEFQLLESQLCHFSLVKVGPRSGGFYIKTHHLISDAWTMTSAVNQILEYYWRIKNNVEIPKGNKPSYIDYIINEAEYKNSARYIKDKEFWHSKFETIPEGVSLANTKRNDRSTKSIRTSFAIPADKLAGIDAFCKKQGISIYIFFLSALICYIGRVTQKKDITIGTPVLNRSNAKQKDTLGMFVSTIPFRVQIEDNIDFLSFAQQVSREWRMALRHYNYPYDLLLKGLREKHKNVDNLYDVVISYQNAKLNKSTYITEYETQWNFNGNQTDPLYVHISDRESHGSMFIDFDYLESLFSYEDIEQIHKGFLTLINNVITSPLEIISQLEIMEEEDENRILFDFNDTGLKYVDDKTVHQLFEEQVFRTPENIAVEFEDECLTFRELNERANQLARVLRDNGVKEDSIVGIMVNRSLEMIIGIMSILKAGGAYLPIDVDYPDERIRFMLEDSGAKILLTQNNLPAVDGYNGSIVTFQGEELRKREVENLDSISSINSLAYVIYTSGSTGKPKGVMLENRGINNLFAGLANTVGYSDKNTVVSITTMSFDIFIFETIIPLLKGSKVVIANKEQQRIPEKLEKVILENEVDVLQTTPSIMQMFLSTGDMLKSLKRLKTIILGGEAFPLTLLEKLRSITNAKIFNGYGPTETTIYSSFKDLTESKEINIGRPVSNTKAYILDSNLNSLPIGKIGELYLGGESLARGYINREELTKTCFIRNPFVPGEYIYKTGDIARWLPNGELECFGRVDHQVKIRGLRIELGEIENHLMNHSQVNKAVVIDRDDEQGRKYLCAYIVSDEELDKQSLRTFLLQKIPSYMIPSYFVQIDEIPLTPNGKVQRDKLPQPMVSSDVDMEKELPTGQIETKLAKIWCKALNLNKIGVNDSFFELGGDSLSIIFVVSAIYREFDVNVSIEDIYRLETIREQAKHIISLERQELSDISSTEVLEYYPLSSAQKRMYILTQLDGGGTAYNMPGALNTEGKIDIQLLDRVFNKLIERHEALRTYFELVDGVPVQKILKTLDFAIELIDGEKCEIGDVINNFVQPFDLATAPLMRVSLVKIAEDRHILLFDTHHIISDGISINILMKELALLYNGNTLPELKIHYKDYALWQNELINSEVLKKQEEYWLKQLSGVLPVLNLPVDYPGYLSKEAKVGSWRFNASKSLSKKIKKLANQTGTTLFMILLSVYNILLSKYSGQDDIIVGTPVAGRNHVDLQNIIGIFVNTLALRNMPKGRMAFIEFLALVKESVLKGLENQDYQFDDLVNKLKLTRDVERNPLFDTMFSLRNTDSPNLKMNDLMISSFELGYGTARFPLVLEAWDSSDGIGFLFDYCLGTFNSNTIRKMGEHYLNILEEILEEPSKKIFDIDMLSKEDKKRIIQSYNMTSIDYPLDKTVDELFQEQVEKTPDNIALIFNDRQISYGQLNKMANQIAWFLRRNGVGPGKVVGIMLNRSVEMIASMLGVIKAGGAYMPIDVHYPDERIKYMLNDSNAVVLITQRERLRDVASPNCKIVLIGNEDISNSSVENPPKINKSHYPIYVIYTSGSTGRPKGVVLTHKPINNFIYVAPADISLSNKTMLCKTTMCFDIFAFETLLPLSRGMKIVLSSQDQHNIPRLLNELIIKHNANITITTPSTLKLMADDPLSSISFKKLTDIIIGGEILDVGLLIRLKELTSAKIFDAYGPAETTIYSTIKELTNTNNINIGKPIGNTKIYILDKDLKLLPEGVVGEICIGGDGLAQGYLNAPELTNSKFIPSPFVKGERIYRTGDLGKWLSNGEIEYIGRIDHQIKIRGIRVETDEIVSVLLEYKGIKEALVADRKEDGREYLCAYIVPQKDVEISITALRLFLSKELPDYMIPSYFVILDKFPLNNNGKVDRSQLPEPERFLEVEEVFKPAEDDIEKTLVSVWSEVLNVEEDKLGVNHNFFELGGDSLSVIQVQTKILHLKWGLSVDDFYKYQTIRKLADRVRGLGNIDDNEDSAFHVNRIGTEINASAFQQNSCNTKAEKRKPSNGGILLTGATGFLGIHILDELLSNTGKRIYCLVRSSNKQEGEERLARLLRYYFPDKYTKVNRGRICVVSGDITLGNLGMDKKDIDIVSDGVNLVIHGAAIVKHYGNYSEFKKINILGTQEVIDFCSNYNKAMAYISTCSVSGSYTENYVEKEIKFTEKDFYIGQSFNNNVYITSKFEAESLVFRAMNRGLEATIFRLGNLTSRYSDGFFQINMHENAFYNMLASIAKIGKISENLLQEKVELTPVDYCSQAIVKLIRYGEPYGKVFHMCNNNTFALEEMINAFKSNGVCIEGVSSTEFERYIAKVSKDKEKQGALAGLIPGLYFQNRLLKKTNIRVDSQITLKNLKKLGFQWPPVDKLYLNKIIKFIKSNWGI